MKPRSLRVVAVVNGMSEIAWNSILSEVQGFYEHIVDLQFTVKNVSLSVQYNGTYPGLFPLAVVDYDWYDRFVTIPNLGSADIVLFLTPKPTAPATFLGFMSSANCGPWECTVFCGPQSDHMYINGVDQGPSNTNLIAHEISHALYYMKGMTGAADRTHEHFLSGNPKDVLNDLSFPPMSGAEQWADLIRRLNGALVALNIIQKTRSVIGDSHEVVTTPPPPPPLPGMKLYNLAKAALGHDIAKTQDEFGCAEAVSGLLNHAYGDFPAEVLSTIDLNGKLLAHAKFAPQVGVVAEKGDIIMCVTGQGSDPADHGHVGILGDFGIMSNDSATGLFKENYTRNSWAASFRPRGFPVHLFRRSIL